MEVESSTFQETIARLAELHRSNPELFELERKQLIEQTIAGFPEHWRQRAYGMQFCLDAKLSLEKDPVSRMNLMVELFWDQVMTFGRVLSDPEDYLARKKRNPAPAKLIPLNPTRH